MNSLISDYNLTQNIIDSICADIVKMLKEDLNNELVKITLFGSCARGDYNEESDVDIAIVIKENRDNISNYNEITAAVSTKLAMKYYQVINILCIPYEEYNSKKHWNPLYKSISKEGKILYG